jgi:hypothetical protein
VDSLALDVKVIIVDPLTTEIQWTQLGRPRREQFCDRGSPGEMQAHVDARIRELQREAHIRSSRKEV